MNLRVKHRAAGPRGFSLIEVMVVVVIIGMLAGAVALKVGGYIHTARTNRAKTDIATIMNAIEEFHLSNSRYPTNEEGLSVLPLENTRDPWGRAYQYASPGQSTPYEVFTLVADGREGGEEQDADLYSWQVRESNGTK